MLLDLSESLACPRCGPPQGMIVLVERMEGRRVLDGRLDCPVCEARFSLRDGIVNLGVGPAPDLPGSPDDPDDSVTAAALLGIRHGRGIVVVGDGLRPAAPEIASLSGGCEVVLLTPQGLPAGYPGTGIPGQESVTPLAGSPEGVIPMLSGRAIGVVLEGGDAGMLDEAARVLAPGGRVVVIRPAADAEAHLRTPPFELLAADSRAIVAKKI